MPPDTFRELNPKHVVPLVLYLCSDSCDENGSLFHSMAGWHAKLRWQRTKGAILHREGIEVTPEMVSERWDEITDWTNADNPTPQDNTTKSIEIIEAKKAGGAKEEDVKSISFTYTERDVILYALGVGVSFQTDYSHLKFLYEGHEDFSVLPTFGVITAQVGFEMFQD